MAQKVSVEVVDDVSGGRAEEQIKFSLDGVSYEIDLSAKNAAKLRDAFSPWVESSRRVGGRKSRRKSRQDLNKVREWGRNNGFTVSDRGRVSTELQEAYDAAQV